MYVYVRQRQNKQKSDLHDYLPTIPRQAGESHDASKMTVDECLLIDSSTKYFQD